jgi:hypothetical protein
MSHATTLSKASKFGEVESKLMKMIVGKMCAKSKEGRQKGPVEVMKGLGGPTSRYLEIK